MQLRWKIKLLAAAVLSLSAIEAQAQGLSDPRYDLFYNYYDGGAQAGGVPVQMYPSPLPVPARVGQTYITYQPLLPHEFMYPHARTYKRVNRWGLPVNTTRVRWW